MTIVIDASLTMAWYLADESTSATEGALHHVVERGAVVPGLWRLEVANAFQAALRRRRIGAHLRDGALAQLSALPIVVDDETADLAWSHTLALSDRLGLTVYDASYLELAQRRGVPLGTLNRALQAAALKLGAALVGLSG